MKNQLFSINSWIFGPASIEDIAKSAHQVGVDGIDISGEPATTNIARVKQALEKYNLRVFCINGNFSDETRVLCHRDADIRANAVAYGKDLVDMAAKLNSPKVLFVPSMVNKTDCFISSMQDWLHAVEGLRQIAIYAKDKGNIQLVIECVNKYEVGLVYTLQEGIQMAKDTGCDNVQIIADTFHMQMEEAAGIPAALREAGPWLGHLHLADNTREVPGRGSMNWSEILRALDSVGYNGAASFEMLPKRMTAEQMFAGELPIEYLVEELSRSLEYLKATLKVMG